MSVSTIIISRSHDGSADRRAFEDSLVKSLSSLGAPRILVVPPLSYLSEKNESLEVLRGIISDPLLASWLHPRAALWTLSYLGITPPDTPISCLNLADFPSPDAAADALMRGIAPVDSPQIRIIDELPSPRWYPVIDHSACINCKQCYDFCLFGVYDLDPSRRVFVAHPDSCKNGCPACARICPVSAIIFPLYAADPKIAGASVAAPEPPPTPPQKSSVDALDSLIDDLDQLDK